MTTKEKLIDNLVNMGLFKNQAEQVFANAASDLETENYKPSWNRPAEDYPEPVYAVWMIALKRHGLKWIEENAPEAWFKALFES